MPEAAPQSDLPLAFVLEHLPLDFNPALEFARGLRFLEAKKLAPFVQGTPSPRWNEQVEHDIRRGLKEYTPGVDYIIPTGSPLRMLLVGMVLGEMGKNHHILGWDAREQKYLKYTLSTGADK